MCKECGCGLAESTTHLQFFVKGYTVENAAAVEKALLGLAGVLYVHIHTHDGETEQRLLRGTARCAQSLGRHQGRQGGELSGGRADDVERLPTR